MQRADFLPTLSCYHSSRPQIGMDGSTRCHGGEGGKKKKEKKKKKGIVIHNVSVSSRGASPGFK